MSKQSGRLLGNLGRLWSNQQGLGVFINGKGPICLGGVCLNACLLVLVCN